MPEIIKNLSCNPQVIETGLIINWQCLPVVAERAMMRLLSPATMSAISHDPLIRQR
jgi:hypothetical protein